MELGDNENVPLLGKDDSSSSRTRHDSILYNFEKYTQLSGDKDKKHRDKQAQDQQHFDKASSTAVKDMDVENENGNRKRAQVQSVSVFQLFRYADFQDKVILFFGVLFAIAHGAANPVLAIIFGRMTNLFIKQGTDTFRVVPDEIQNRTLAEFNSKVSGYAYSYLYLAGTVMILAFLQTICFEISCARQMYRIRRIFFHQVLRQEINWFENNQTGNLAVKLLDDIERIREAIGQKFSLIIQSFSNFTIGLIIGLTINWKLTLVILSLTPLLSVKAAILGQFVVTHNVRERLKYAQAGNVAVEVLSSTRTVAAFGGEKYEINRYKSGLMEGMKIAIKKFYIQASGTALSYLLMYSSYGIAFGYAGYLLGYHLIIPGEIYTIFFATIMGAFALGHALPDMAIVSVAQTSAASIFRIIDTVPEVDPYSKDGLFLEKVLGKVEFHKIYFSYPSRHSIPVLKKLSLSIEPGQTIGIVGSSGSGKSTLLSLLLRFYEPDGGKVLLDGTDIRYLNLQWLRMQIGYVSQEPVLFTTTIYQNISLGAKNPTYEQVVEAAKLANAHEFIMNLPQNYNTPINSAKISGGQKQRIAIARAILKNPKILLLDEATSALDGKSESQVQEGLRKARVGRTTIIIAHRLSTIRDVDIIYAMKEGEIVESGSHDELMENEGLYYDLVMSQAPMETVEDAGAESAISTAESEAEDEAEVIETEFRKKKRRVRAISAEDVPIFTKQELRNEIEAREDLVYPSIFKIFKLNKPEWHILGAGLVGCIICGWVKPGYTFLYADMLTSFRGTKEQIHEEAFFISLMFLVLAIVSAVGYFLNTLFISWAGEYLTMRLRLESYTAVIRQPISWFDEDGNSPSRISTRLSRDAPLVKAAAGEKLGLVIVAIVTIFGSLLISFYYGWQLASVIVVAFPILVASGYVQIKIQKGSQMRESQNIENSGIIAIETIQNIRTVQAICRQEYFYEKYRDTVFPVFLESQKQGFAFGLALGFSSAIIYVIYSGAFLYGSHLVAQHVLTPEIVYRVFFSIVFCAMSVGHTTNYVPDFQKAKLASALIFNLIQLKSKVDPLDPTGRRPVIVGEIEFKNVYFAYPTRPEIRVLQGLSFKISPNQTVAIVGKSGSGKSTVVSLLERFYDILAGQVLIDGIDVREYNVGYLRRNMALVQQEPVLFDATIRDNIAYGCVAQTEDFEDGSDRVVPRDEEIYASAKAANIHDFIMERYNTIVGEKAVQLSGGQKQRIAIARALIRNPKILLLDEATSALDSESEQIVQEALDKARQGRTCVIIAHRLSTIQSSDLIIVMSKGRIVEMGSPEALTFKKGIYYKLTKKQRVHAHR